VAVKKKYELTIMVRAEVKDEARDKLVDKLEKTAKAIGGNVVKTMEMGRKQLAYKISGQTEAVFLNLVLELPPAEVIQLEKKLTVDKEILRHLLVVA
jgi:small subunit ribosomal protein S6